MSDIRLKRITVEPLQSPLIIQKGDVKITNTTASTSILDGALVVNGGTSINTTYDSVSSTSGGAMTVAGGVGIMKNVYIGKDLNLDSSNGIFRILGLTEPRLFLDSVANKNFYVAPDGVNKRLELSDTSIHFNITKTSTNITEGALHIKGGISISCTEDVSNASNGGAMTIAGGVAVGKNISVAKQVVVGETDSNNAGLTIRYTGQDQIVLHNNGIGYASINMEGDDLVVDNDNDIVFQTFSGNVDFINTGSSLKMISVHSDNTEFLQHLHISNTKVSSSSSVGCLLLNGGQSINNTTDSMSQTSGGSFTTLGGVAIAKKTFTGDSIGIDVANNRRNKLVLWNQDYDLTQIHQFSGLGSVSSGSVVYQVNNTASNHIFYAGSSGSSSDQVFSICGNRDVIISGKDQPYKIIGGGLNDDAISFQSYNTGSSVNFFTASGENTDSNQICIFAKGTPNAVTDSEYLELSWDSSRYTLTSKKLGTGDFHNIVLSASTIDQITLQTNGSVILASDTVSSNSSSGALVLQSGGLSINETSDSSNISNGGALTVAGGASVSKDVFIGGSINLGMTENIKFSERVIESTYSSLVLTSAENYYPHIQLVADSSVSGTEHPVSFVLYNLGSDLSVDKQALSITTRDDLSGYYIKTQESGAGVSKSLTLHTSTYDSQLVLETSGNVGISTNTPEYVLDVNGTLHATGRVLFTSSVTSTNSTTGCLVTEGGISISSTRDAESLTRGGALTVAGGAAIEKNMVVGGITEFLDTTPSTSVMEASVIVNGGLSIKSGENSVNVLNGGGLTVAGGGAFSGDLYVGGSINGSGSSSSTYAYLTLTATDDAVNLSTGTLLSLGGLTLQSDTNAINISNGGSILTPGGASIGRDVYIGGDISLTRGIMNYYTEDDNILNFYDAFNIRRFSIDRASSTQIFSVTRYDSLGNSVEKCFEITNSDGNTVFNNTISSTDKDTASVVFRGGISISKTTNATSLQNGGGLTIAGGASIAKSVFIGGDVRMSSSTASDNVSTGALLVAGGVGISGNLNVLGSTLIVGNLTVRGQTTTVDTTNTSLKDNVFLLNSGPTGSSDSGFMISRYQNDNNIGSGDVVADTYPAESITLPDQTGMTGVQLKLTVGANALNDYYTGWWVKVSSGFSNNQVRKIMAYNGTTKIATLSSGWSNQNPSVGDVVRLYNKPFVGVVYNETLDRFDFGATVQDPNQTSVIFTDRIPICYSSATSVSTEASSSVSSGALLMSGGISIVNTTEAQSVTSGGTFTTLGGGSFAKSVYIGNNLQVNGANMTPSPYDMFSIRSFNAANNQGSFVNITGLQFDSSVCGFDCYLTAKLTATSNLYVNFHIRGVNKDSSWEIVKTYVGDDTGIQFNITEFGQLQYTTPTYTGFVSLVFRWRALVT